MLFKVSTFLIEVFADFFKFFAIVFNIIRFNFFNTIQAILKSYFFIKCYISFPFLYVPGILIYLLKIILISSSISILIRHVGNFFPRTQKKKPSSLILPIYFILFPIFLFLFLFVCWLLIHATSLHV